MKYITDIHALNLPCALGTTGDWHTSSLQWKHPRMLESSTSVFGDWGIEKNRNVTPLGNKKYAVANHIRALLDMLAQNRFTVAQGMNGTFIDNSCYDNVIFNKVLLLKPCSNWENIDKFMTQEYKMKWLKFKKGLGNASSVK